MSTTRHWTERSVEDFAYGVASDYFDLIRDEMDKQGCSKAKLARMAKLSKGRITQIFQNPGNIEMITITKIARALKLKLALFPYRDSSDPRNERGPINSEVFRLCWEQADSPVDMWAIREKVATPSTTLDTHALIERFAFSLQAIAKSLSTESGAAGALLNDPISVRRKESTLAGMRNTSRIAPLREVQNA